MMELNHFYNYSINKTDDKFNYDSFSEDNQDIMSFLLHNENEKNEYKFGMTLKNEEPSTNITNLLFGIPEPKYNPKFDSLYVINENLKAHNIYLFSEKDLEEVQKQLEKITQKQKINKDEDQKEDRMTNRKRKNNSDEIQEKEKKLGRKKRDDSKGKHNKFSPDNIIKKLKGIIIENLIFFVNKIIQQRTHKGTNVIKKLDYKEYTGKLKVDINMKEFQKTIKEILSYKITSKFRKIEENSNKINIESILEEYQNDNIIQFVFNLKMDEWIDIFLLNKKLEDFRDLNESERQSIKIPDINELFNAEKNDEKYLAHCIFWLYNYKNYFYMKKARKSKKKKENKNE